MGDFQGHPFRGNQWTGGGGVTVSRGDYRRVREDATPYGRRSNIPAGLDVASEYDKEKLDDIFNSGRFVTKVTTKPGYYSGTTDYLVDIRARKGRDQRLKRVPPSYPGDTRKRYYDADVAEIGEDGRYKMKNGWASSIDELTGRKEGSLFRGMSYEELESILASETVKSKGAFNLGEAELGLTYYSVDPGQAESYAHGFAPFTKQASGNKPAIIIEVRDPKRNGTMVRGDERGVPGQLTLDDIVAVYVGRRYTYAPGQVEYTVGRSGKHEEGSRSVPSGSVAWKRVDLAELKKKRRP